MERKSGRFDVYGDITDRIIATIEAGAGEAVMPWHREGVAHTRPVNIDSGNAYRGVNVVSLWASAEAQGFTTGIWGTYRQWRKADAQVRRGEKASLVVFYKEIRVDEPEGDEDDGKRRVVRASWVFNADQVDGYEVPLPELGFNDPAERVAKAEDFVASTGADIRHGGQAAYYRLSDDRIRMPDRERFIGSDTSTATESYYGVLFHELTHWTAPDKRCGRELGKRFGDFAYAMEELVAELGAAFLCADLAIAPEPRDDHAQYIADWLNVMKRDKKAIFTAAARASEAVDYLTGLQPA